MEEDRGLDVIKLDGEVHPLAYVVGVLLGIGFVIIAIAAWQASVGLALGFGAAGVGVGGLNLAKGISYIVLAAGRHRAEVITAQGKAIAEQTRAKAALIEARQYRLIGKE